MNKFESGQDKYTLWSPWFIPGIIGDTEALSSISIKSWIPSPECTVGFCTSACLGIVEKVRVRGRSDWTRWRTHANMDIGLERVCDAVTKTQASAYIVLRHWRQWIEY